MAQAFGVRRWGKTKYGNDCVLHEHSSGGFYVFTIKKRTASRSTWKCSGCFAVKPRSQPVPLISVENGHLLNDSENPKNQHFCQPFPAQEVEAKQIVSEAGIGLKQSRKRPRTAYRESLTHVAAKFPNDSNFRKSVEAEMPAFKQVRTSLYRAYNERYPVIPSIAAIPPELKITLEGAASTNQNDPAYQESSLIFCQSNPPLLIFATRQDLKILRDSLHWVADGTFQYHPKDVAFAQLYVIFGYVNNEAVPCVHALLPDKTTATYQTMFPAINNSLIQHYGTNGALSMGHFDFEEAALSAFHIVFPSAAVKGCAFHFAQAIIRNIGAKGLKSVYEQGQAQGYNAPQYIPVATWVRRIIALCLLPRDMVLPFWHRVLKFPPFTGTPTVDSNLQSFAAYVENQWLRDQDTVDVFNHYDHDGPRTNNSAEGHNNGLRSKFPRVHPRLSVFLVEFQEIHHDVQVRCRQLLNGAPPNARLKRYIDNYNKIAHAKQVFIGIIRGLNTAAPNYLAMVDAEVAVYLDQVKHFLG